MRLEVFLAPHCATCHEALRLVERVRHDFPAVEVRIHDLEAAPEARPPEVFAVPTYVLDGRVFAIGNPDVETLAAALGPCMAVADRRTSRRDGSRVAAMLGGILAVLSCGSLLMPLGLAALQPVSAPPLVLRSLATVGYGLQNVADPLWASGLVLLIAGLARQGRWPLLLAIGGSILLHASMLDPLIAPGLLPAPRPAAMLLLLTGLAAIGGALLLGVARHSTETPLVS
jgi:glutaredoxin